MKQVIQQLNYVYELYADVASHQTPGTPIMHSGPVRHNWTKARLHLHVSSILHHEGVFTTVALYREMKERLERMTNAESTKD